MATHNDLVGIFPHLANEGYEWTSPETSRYNCVAWAVKDDTKWWEPDLLESQYWPDTLPRDASLDGYKKLFEHYGYSECNNRDFENGFEKIAIYSDLGTFTHVCRQLDDGKWTSKLGSEIDLTHSLRALENAEYGTVTMIMRRKKN